jgi:hypothetical protein
MTIPFPTTWDRPGLEALNFEGYVPLIGLDAQLLPPRRGIYVVLREATIPPEFVDANPIRRKKAYTVARLEEKTTGQLPIVYLGSADGKEGLRDRVGVFSRQSSSHTGGRALWQLKDADLLIVAWKETPDEVSEVVEKRWLVEFKRKYGAYPLANWRL